MIKEQKMPQSKQVVIKYFNSIQYSEYSLYAVVFSTENRILPVLSK